MNYLTILSLIPKLALFLLLLVGGAIFVEIFYLIRGKRAKKEETAQVGQEAVQELKNTSPPLKFPEGAGKEEKGKVKSGLRKKAFSLAVIFGSLVGLALTLIVVRQRQEIRKEAAPPAPAADKANILPSLSPSAVNPPQCLEIKVYKVVDNTWQDWSERLSLLQAGEEIKIAVAGRGSYNSALFKVNGKIIGIGPSTKKNAFGEFYVSYTIPVGLTDFRLEAELL